LSDLATQADVFQKACLDSSEEKSQDLLVTESLARNIIRVNGILSKIESPEVESTSYEEIMKPFMFQYVDLAIYNDEYRKFILDNIKVYKSIPHSTNRMNRIAKELATLSTSLPCSPWSSIFLRVDETRIDVLNALITGPVDTPYQNGCFEFDIFIPPDYPNSPPKVILITTGKGTVRFNPNLYNCGKVCLSLLGTWQGSREEMWNPSQSTLLQVLVSIQSLILVDLPYFNEPGYGIPRKELPQSQNYNRRVRHDCLMWAILDMLKNPPPIWEDVVFSHFKAKKKEIIMQCEEWKLLDKQVATVAKQITDILKSRKFKSTRN
jgi:baculoviral IAP repeat-containing protein 6